MCRFLPPALTLWFSTVLVGTVFGASFDSNAHFPSTISNCSNDVPQLQSGSYFSQFGSQITGNNGWETWTITVPHVINNSLSVFTWTRGDPASASSCPDDVATFSVLSARHNFSASVTDKFVYEQTSSGKIQISIADNRLSFDPAFGGSWNLSVSIDGMHGVIVSGIVPPGVPLVPYYKNKRSEIVDGYFTSILVTRGHSDGPLTFPSGETWLVHDVSTVKYAYAKKPIQELVSSYIRGSAFVLATSVNWIHAQSIEATGSVISDAAQLVIGTSDVLSLLSVKYQATNDFGIFNVSSPVSSSLNTTIVFAGCAATQYNPYQFAAFPIAYRGAFVDSAGGETAYYSINASSSIWLDELTVGNGSDSQGIIEIYRSLDELARSV